MSDDRPNRDNSYESISDEALEWDKKYGSNTRVVFHSNGRMEHWRQAQGREQ